MSSAKPLATAAAVAVVLIGAGAAVAGSGRAAPATGSVLSGQAGDCPVSASLLRRLGEAADAYRTGADLFIVADCQHPHTVAGVADEEDLARDIASEAGGTYAVFGPYRNPAGYELRPTDGAPALTETDAAAGMLIPTCHEEPTEWVSCFWTEIWPCSEVDSVTLTVTHESGVSQSASFPGCSVDAMFLTMSAIDKFAIPYYLRILGVEDVALRRGQIIRWSMGAIPMPEWLRRHPRDSVR